jgi:hypothetical protein
VDASRPPAWFFAVWALTPIFVYLFYKMMTAKTRRAYVGYFLASMLLGAIVSSTLSVSGLLPFPDAKPPLPQPLDSFMTALPWQVIAAGVLWIGGGYYIMARQYRKAGLSWWKVFDPFDPPFRHMDRAAWVKTLLLAIVALGLTHWGIAESAKDAARGKLPAVSQPGRN